VFAECLAVELACRDQRRLAENCSALETLRDDALYKSTYFTFLWYWAQRQQNFLYTFFRFICVV